MSKVMLLNLAERADIREEIEPFIDSAAWERAKEKVQEAGESLARSMGRNSKKLPYSFAVIMTPSAQGHESEKELYALQILFQKLCVAHLR